MKWITNDQMDEMTTPLWVFCLVRQWVFAGVAVIVLAVLLCSI